MSSKTTEIQISANTVSDYCFFALNACCLYDANTCVNRISTRRTVFPIPVHFCRIDVTFNTFYRPTVLIFDHKFSLNDEDYCLKQIWYEGDGGWTWVEIWSLLLFSVLVCIGYLQQGFCTLTVLICYDVNFKVLVCIGWSDLQYFYVALTISICLCAMNISLKETTRYLSGTFVVKE